MSTTSSPGPEKPKADYPRPGYAWYVVGVLTVAYVFSFLDRQIISFTIDPIRRDFKLTNLEVAVLGGPAFALFYTVFGLPVGRWADTRSRRALIAVGFVLWSCMTAASGLARQFWQLLLCRVGVGVGEATLSPAAYSLIADYFPPQRRATAIGVYSFGIYFGTGLSFICLGLLTEFLKGKTLLLPLLGDLRPWQAVFLMVGLPGVLCAGLLATVREVPRRGAGAGEMSLRQVFAYLSSHRGTFLSLFLGMGCLALAGYANSFWVITFFTSRHAWSEAHTGTVVGLIIAVGGALGAVGGGRLADVLRSRGQADANLRVALLGAGLMAIASVVYPLAGSGGWAAAGLALLVMGFSAPFGLVAAAIQQLVPAVMRAQASALFLFVVNLIGMGLGPVVVGWLRDLGHPLHLSLMAALLQGSVAGLALFALGLKPYRRTIQEAANQANEPALKV